MSRASRSCASCFGALERAGITTADLACLVVNTPTVWYADFACRVLGVDRQKALSTFQRYANTGTALLPINLYESVKAGMLRDGDWVLFYSVGSASTASATVMRWTDAALG